MVFVGLQGVAYYLSSGTRASWGSLTAGVAIAAAPSNLVAVPSIRNCNLGLNVGEADASSRASLVKLTVLALEEWQVELEIPYNPTNTDYIFLQAARIQRITIAMAFLDGPKATSGSFGIWADFVVTGFGRDEPLEKEMMVKATLKPTSSAVAPQWVQVM
jgi:hypothetical protein